MIGHLLGLDDAGGHWYLFWSGFGADIPILFGVLALLRKHNCHTRGCWRLGRHPGPDGATRCRRHHHPQLRLTIAVGEPPLSPNGDSVAIQDDQQELLTAQAHDRKGFQVPAAQPITWQLSDPNGSGAQLNDNGDGTAELVAGTPGGVDVTATSADGLTAQLHVDVQAGAPVTLSIAEGTPTQQ